MTTAALSPVLWGALAMSAWAAGLFFLKFWRGSGDRLFAFMAAAFWALSVHWLWLAIARTAGETTYGVFLLRLLAFVLIIVGVVDKNRRGASR